MLNEDLSIPPPIRESGISLEADMIFGWKPNRPCRGPIALSYNARFPVPKRQLIYKGPRPHNSYAVHSAMNAGSYSYEEPEGAYLALSSTIGRPQQKLGMLSEDCPVFNSQFECGNLDKVYSCLLYTSDAADE